MNRFMRSTRTARGQGKNFRPSPGRGSSTRTGMSTTICRRSHETRRRGPRPLSAPFRPARREAACRGGLVGRLCKHCQPGRPCRGHEESDAEARPRLFVRRSDYAGRQGHWSAARFSGFQLGACHRLHGHRCPSAEKPVTNLVAETRCLLESRIGVAVANFTAVDSRGTRRCSGRGGLFW